MCFFLEAPNAFEQKLLRNQKLSYESTGLMGAHIHRF